MRHLRSVQLAGSVTVLGGCLWLFALEMRTFTLAMVLCWAGVLATYTSHTVKRWPVTVGFSFTLLGTMSWLAAWLTYDSSFLLGTTVRRSETGQIIDVINYTLGDIARRDLTIIPFFIFGIGLLLMAYVPPRIRSMNVVFRLLGLLSIGLFVWLAWDRYLDAITPPLVYATLKLLFGLGWVAVGYLLVARGSHYLPPTYRRVSEQR